MKKTKYWCMGCGAYGEGPCEEVGHITQKYFVVPSTTASGTLEPGPTTIAATYQGRLQHLVVKIPVA